MDTYDIFISYASASNDLPPPFERWVTQFVDALKRMLKARLGREQVGVYFDLRNVEPNQLLAEIIDACRTSTLFIALASPAYHARAWPGHELEAFLAASPDPRRLFIAELQPTPEADQLPGLRGRHRVNFHRAPSSAEAREPIPLAPASELFFERISDLSASICAQLERVRRTRAPTEAKSKQRSLAAAGDQPSSRPVLLCQVTDDLADERDAVRRYLEQYCISVLPEQDYPQGGQAFEAAFAKDLERCDLAVQLLGPWPGRTPPDLKIGYARHQALAAKAAKLELMQWRRSDVGVDQVRDTAHRELLFGETVTASTLEQFKSDVLGRVRRPVPRIRAKPDFLVFVNAERSDRLAARQMRDALAHAYSVVLPLEDIAGSIQNDLNENLRECDALLLVYGDAGPDWVRAQLRHLRKARAGQPVLTGAICYGPPPVKPQVDFSIPGFDEIDCRTADGAAWSVEPVRGLATRWKP